LHRVFPEAVVLEHRGIFFSSSARLFLYVFEEKDVAIPK